MNRCNTTLLHRIAARLVRHAAKVLPPKREHWADAMAGELAHIPDSPAALKWAVGCVFASYSERVKNMTAVRPGLSRWVLCVEMLCFFGMPALGFLDVLTPPYYTPLRETIFVLSFALLGPVGLAVAFRTVVLNRPALPPLVTWALGILAAWALLAFLMYLLVRNGTMDLDWWRGYILVALLPALAAAHLIYLSSHSRTVDATMA
jgi:hypothetical protein